MAKVVIGKKNASVNPLKMSQPIGAALAFMGLRGCMPLLHGSQGCTSFGLVLFVRHFKEAIPMQTTAMSEVATVLGGFENVEQAVLNIVARTKPEIIGIASTGVTETKGDDIEGFLRLIRQRNPELKDFPLVSVSTPDYVGAFQDGFAKAVTRLVEDLVRKPENGARKNMRAVNVLPGSHLSPGDIEELRGIIEDFGLEPTFLPDIGQSLDGHIPDDFTPTTLGGVGVEQVYAMGDAGWTIAVGEQMRAAAQALEAKTCVPFRLFEKLCGLEAGDDLIAFLMEISGRPAPIKYRRQRGQLVDAMLDGHFHIGGKKLAIGAEPDMLLDIGSFLHGMGAQILAAVTTTQSPALEKLETEEVLVGDLEDLETLARERNCDLLVTHSHGRQAAERLKIPFHRMGIPMFDRIGAGHKVFVGYRGTRDLIFEVANLIIAHREAHAHVTPDTWRNPWRDPWPEENGAAIATPSSH